MNTGRAIANHIALNKIRKNDILEILKDGPKTAYKISLEMPEVCSQSTVLCHLYELKYELKAAGRVKNFGGLWKVKT
ncbi:hypothetical protein Q5692_18980 [Microcoleus sp. C2C3]|uniref:hypothetical protein n=1 Tax=unclassified Microcoleus TaxID=2642155 RepID=UPI002FD33263